jgi:hypothetical protein
LPCNSSLVMTLSLEAITSADLYRGAVNDGKSGFFANFDSLGRLRRIEFRSQPDQVHSFLELDPDQVRGERWRPSDHNHYKDGEASFADNDPLGDGQNWKVYKIDFLKWCREELRRFYNLAAPEVCTACGRGPDGVGTLKYDEPMLSNDVSARFVCHDCGGYFHSGLTGLASTQVPAFLSSTAFSLEEPAPQLSCLICNKSPTTKVVKFRRFGWPQFERICEPCAARAASFQGR